MYVEDQDTYYEEEDHYDPYDSESEDADTYARGAAPVTRQLAIRLQVSVHKG